MAITAGVGPSQLTGWGGGTTGGFTLNGCTAGRSLVLMLGWHSEYTVTISSITITDESNATPIAASLISDSGFASAIQILYLSNITTSGNKTFSITMSASVTNLEAWAQEYIGGETSGFLDTGDGSATARSVGTTGQVSIDTAAANCLVIGQVTATNDKSGWTENSGFSLITMNNLLYYRNGVYDLDVGAAGTKTPGFALGASVDYMVSAAAFRPATGGISIPAIDTSTVTEFQAVNVKLQPKKFNFQALQKRWKRKRGLLVPVWV